MGKELTPKEKEVQKLIQAFNLWGKEIHYVWDLFDDGYSPRQIRTLLGRAEDALEV